MKLIRIFLASVLSLISLNGFSAITIEHYPGVNTHLDKTVGPTATLSASTKHNQKNVGTVSVELGQDNYRISGTIASRIGAEQNQAVKVTAETLWQKPSFDFYTGVVNHWVHQTAIGASYAYFPSLDCNPDSLVDFYEVNGYISEAPSVDLAPITVFDANLNQNITNFRRIAGSTADGFAAGAHFHLGNGFNFEALGNYDYVKYHTVNIATLKQDGIGGTIKLRKNFVQCTSVEGEASFRKPYTEYKATLSHSFDTAAGQIDVGAHASWIKGSSLLRDQTIYGASLSFAPDKHEDCHCRGRRELGDWMSKPAIHSPTVLTIADNSVPNIGIGNNTCVPPTAVGGPTIAIPVPPNTNPGTFDVAPYFAGTSLIYTIQTISANVTTASVSASGILSYDVDFTAGSGVIVIRASNACGQVAQIFRVDDAL
ncbi:MAG: hypothetical protein KDH94_05750 [Coxiellaceae bacterium]|nr:hypothetical protein [Coxiellaceae bacterium]